VGVPEVFAGFRDSKPLDGLTSSSVALQLPIGTYTVGAKVTILNDNGATGDVSCRLDGVSAFDISQASLSSSIRKQTLSFDITKIANSPALIFLSCRNSHAGMDSTMSFAKVTAIRVADPNHLHNAPLLG
jgi:hypothetical protein